MSMLRFKVAKEAFSRKAVPVNEPKERPSEYFGKYVFNRERCLNTYLKDVRSSYRSDRQQYPIE